MNTKGAKPGQRNITTSPGEGWVFSSTQNKTVLEPERGLSQEATFLTQMPQVARRPGEGVGKKP